MSIGVAYKVRKAKHGPKFWSHSLIQKTPRPIDPEPKKEVARKRCRKVHFHYKFCKNRVGEGYQNAIKDHASPSLFSRVWRIVWDWPGALRTQSRSCKPCILSGSWMGRTLNLFGLWKLVKPWISNSLEVETNHTFPGQCWEKGRPRDYVVKNRNLLGLWLEETGVLRLGEFY